MQRLEYQQLPPLQNLLDELGLDVYIALYEVERLPRAVKDRKDLLSCYASRLTDIEQRALKILSHPQLKKYEMSGNWTFFIIEPIDALLKDINYYEKNEEKLDQFLSLSKNKLTRARTYVTRFLQNIPSLQDMQ